jgi:hypothetical protein
MKSPAELIRHAIEHEGSEAIPQAPSFLDRSDSRYRAKPTIHGCTSPR